MILSEEHMMIKDMAHEFCRDKLAPGAEERSINKTFPADLLKEMGQLGLLGMLIPEQWGGSNIGALGFVLAMEEVAAADGACSTIISAHSSPVTTALLNYGTDAQKEKWLKPLASGQMVGAFALTEASAGSDASAIKTKAVCNGDDWIINGSKQFITSGKNGGAALVFAITDPDAGKKGLSAFIVSPETKGYIVSKVEDKFGQHSSDTCALSFDDMRVSADQMLGDEGDGYKIALSNLEGGRLGIAAQSIGMARAAYFEALSYAKERESFGKLLSDHQSIAFRLADMATKIEVARQMLHHAASLKDAGKPCTKEACMAKLYASEMAEQVANESLQIFGGYGYLDDYPIGRIYRDVRVCSIYEGTSDIQRIIISRQILKDNP